jgi:hypothetical protein
VFLKTAIQIDPPYKIASEALQDVQQAMRFKRPANTGMQPTAQKTRRG